jgi:hypothetical protein
MASDRKTRGTERASRRIDVERSAQDQGSEAEDLRGWIEEGDIGKTEMSHQNTNPHTRKVSG